MLKSVNELLNYTIEAEDGKSGKIKDFYFYDENWKINCCVVKPKWWMFSKRVLLLSQDLGHPVWSKHKLPVFRSKREIDNSPLSATKETVSDKKKKEAERQRANWPVMWNGGDYMSSNMMNPHIVPQPQSKQKDRNDFSSRQLIQQETKGKLRSMTEVRGYRIQATDGALGHVDDFIVEEANWYIPYLVVATRDYLPGPKVLLMSIFVDKIDWGQSKILLNVSKNRVLESPAYDPANPVNYEEEMELKAYDFCGRPVSKEKHSIGGY